MDEFSANRLSRYRLGSSTLKTAGRLTAWQTQHGAMEIAAILVTVILIEAKGGLLTNWDNIERQLGSVVHQQVSCMVRTVNVIRTHVAWHWFSA
jgi:hypothetical protein